jgi:plasmid maintenance system antidote protein VapI
LEKFFAGTSAGFWMNLQLRWDLYQAKKSEEKELASIRPFAGPPNLAV